ncbi:WBC30 protein, partial [Chloropsis cyanopogon]|nr:WBC30 protein [Chloropsis cyanopogon]
SQVTGPCLAGFYCSGGAASPTPRDAVVGNTCPQGSYCPLGSASPLPCPPGQYSSSAGNTGIQDCLLCDAAGLFPCVPGPGAQTPELCPAGHFCLPGTTFSTEHPCPRGTFGPRPGATSESDCEPCPAGMYCSAPGLSQPSGFCYPGYHCAKGAISPAPFKHRVSPCPPGHFCEEGSSRAQPCPAGTYSPAWSGTRCLECPEGFYCTSAPT